MSKADNVWWTRKAKIENEARLLKYDFHGQILLLWYSFFSVAMSILTLNESSFLKALFKMVKLMLSYLLYSVYYLYLFLLLLLAKILKREQQKLNFVMSSLKFYM